MHSLILSEIFSKKEEILNSSDPNLVSNLIYTFAYCRLPKENRKKIREEDEFKQEAITFVNAFNKKLLEDFNSMDIETCVRLLIGMSILRMRDYNDILLKAQKLINKNMGNLGN